MTGVSEGGQHPRIFKDDGYILRIQAKHLCAIRHSTVITIGDGIPSRAAMEANWHALARCAVLCQEAGLVPIVEPEVLMQGAVKTQHGIAFLSGGQSAVLNSLGEVFT